MKITIDTLYALSACAEQIREFEKLFPDGIEVSLEAVKKALDARLDLEWLAWKLFAACKALPEYLEAAKTVRGETWLAAKSFRDEFEVFEKPYMARYREAMVVANRIRNEETVAGNPDFVIERNYTRAENAAVDEYVRDTRAAKALRDAALAPLYDKERQALAAVFYNAWRKYENYEKNAG